MNCGGCNDYLPVKATPADVIIVATASDVTATRSAGYDAINGVIITFPSRAAQDILLSGE